jgi:hypothetical protein
MNYLGNLKPQTSDSNRLRNYICPMSCTFSLPITSDPQTALDKARKAVQSQGGSFEGDASNGKFSVSVFGNTIGGTYAVNGSDLAIHITEKPFLLPCPAIESYLKGAIS